MENKNNDSTINTATTLWIVLFSLILTQKIIKYVIKPCQRVKQQQQQQQQNNNNEENQNEHDPSVECLIV